MQTPLTGNHSPQSTPYGWLQCTPNVPYHPIHAASGCSQPQQMLTKNPPKSPLGMSHLVATTLVKHSSHWQPATLHEEVRCSHMSPTQQSQIESNIKQPWTIFANRKVAISVLPPIALHLHRAFQPPTDDILPPTTANLQATVVLLSQLQQLFYPPMLYNIKQFWTTNHHWPTCGSTSQVSWHSRPT